MFSGYEISLAKKNVMARDVYIKGAEDLEEVMPDLIVKMFTRLSQNIDVPMKKCKNAKMQKYSKS